MKHAKNFPKRLKFAAAIAIALAGTAISGQAQAQVYCPPGYYYDPYYGCAPLAYFYGPPYYAYPDLGFSFFYGPGFYYGRGYYRGYGRGFGGRGFGGRGFGGGGGRR